MTTILSPFLLQCIIYFPSIPLLLITIIPTTKHTIPHTDLAISLTTIKAQPTLTKQPKIRIITSSSAHCQLQTFPFRQHLFSINVTLPSTSTSHQRSQNPQFIKRLSTDVKLKHALALPSWRKSMSAPSSVDAPSSTWTVLP